MNHLKIYNVIIEKAKFERRKKLKKTDPNYVYYERHHIIPRCLDGLNDKENLVLLTAREHFICHKLLIYIYPKNHKLLSAFSYMVNSNQGNVNISSRDYTLAKEFRSNNYMTDDIKKKIKKTWETTKETPKFKEHIKKIIDINKNRIRSEKELENLSKSLKGKKFTEEHKENLRKSINEKGLRKGEKNSMFGKKHSDEAKEKNRLSHIGKTVNGKKSGESRLGKKRGKYKTKKI